MALITKMARAGSIVRLRAIDKFRRNPIAAQQQIFEMLLKQGASTQFGREYAISRNMNWEQFSQKVPVFEYDAFKPYIERMINGETNVSCPGRVTQFAKSSGTTSDRSKYIPVSDASMRNNHMKGMRDVGSIYITNNQESRVFDGKFLSLGGSCSTEGENLVGDLSALLINNFRIGGEWFRSPKMSSALLKNFDQKCEQICEQSTKENITAFVGVPSWNLALMSRVLEYTGKSTLKEVWPQLELFAHGGIEMGPYRASFDRLYGGEGLNYLETYNASEGFIAIADDPARSDMLLMLDYDTFYEFRSGDEVVPLEGVKIGGSYAVIMTSSNGLWRYEVGDTVEFTSINPYRIRFAGRTKQFINVFGEEVMVDNTDRAINKASEKLGVVVSDYSIAPRFMGINSKGGHEWLIEFMTPPSDIEAFTSELDRSLRSINSDYDAKRESTLDQLKIVVLQRGSFLKWMSLNGKNKVPRLSNDRKAIESILSLSSTIEL